MDVLLDQLRAQSIPARCATVGMLACGAIGAVAGLIIGLNVHAATAWAAMFELGVPSLIGGAALGWIVGGTVWLFTRQPE
jgi:hypothetical protein